MKTCVPLLVATLPAARYTGKVSDYVQSSEATQRTSLSRREYSDPAFASLPEEGRYELSGRRIEHGKRRLQAHGSLGKKPQFGWPTSLLPSHLDS